MYKIFLCAAAGIVFSGIAAAVQSAPLLENSAFIVSLDGGSQRLEVVDQRNRTRWRQVSLPSPPVFNVSVRKERPSLNGKSRGWDLASGVVSAKGNRFVLNWSPENRELYLYAEVSKGWRTGDAIEVWIGDSQISLSLNDAGEVVLLPGKYYEEKKAPELYGTVMPNGCLFQAALPMKNFISLNGWDETQKFVAVAFNVKQSAGGFSDRWPKENDADNLWSFAQARLSAEKNPSDDVRLFDPVAKDVALSGGVLSFKTLLCAMSRAGAVQVPGRVELLLTENGVLQKILPEPVSVTLHDLIWPCSFVLDEKESRTIYPNDSGMLVPTAVNHPHAVNEAWVYDGMIYDFNGTTEACLGMTDGISSNGKGFLTIVEPPWTAHYRSQAVDVSGTFYRVPFFYWYADQGVLEKEYGLTHCFTEAGSYSALAKQYREYLQGCGRFKTFTEKVREQPLNKRIIGAPVFWLYSAKGPESFIRIAEQMKADGIDRAVLNLDPYYYETLGLHDFAMQMEQVVVRLADMGFIVSRYDQYRDTHPKVSGRSVYEQWNTSAYDCYAEDYRGDKIAGFGTDSRVITPEAALQLAEKNVTADTARYPYNARFYDCFGIISAYLDSDFHKGQETGVRRVQEIRKAIFSTATARGMLAGSEGGADWSLPFISWPRGP